MRCLYCGKPLPLLKKLTGGGEFCSDAHRNKYQEEYNKLALSRLLQAQGPVADAGGPQPASRARQLPAPGVRPGQRALPPPAPPPGARSATRALPAPGASSAPPSMTRDSLPPTPKAPAQPWQPAALRATQSIPVPPPPPPVSAAPPPPPPPQPPPLPDPPFASFRIPRYQPESKLKPGPVRSGDVVLEFLGSITIEPPIRSDHEILPFDWATLAAEIAEANRPVPDPPEAPAWDHPFEFAKPGAFTIQGIGEAPWFGGQVMYPAAPDYAVSTRAPIQLRKKVSLPRKSVSLFQRQIPAAFGSGKWDLPIPVPAWKPRLNPVASPVIKVPAANHAFAIPQFVDLKEELVLAATADEVMHVPLFEEAATMAPLDDDIPVAARALVEEAPVKEPLEVEEEAVGKPEPQKIAATSESEEESEDPHVEVYIDLSVLGLLEDKPARRAN